MNLADWTIPLGIITYILLFLNVLIGSRVIVLHIRWHRLIGYITLGFATVHLFTVIYYQF